MLLIIVVKEAERVAEILHAFEIARREVAIKSSQPIIECFEPSLNVVAFAARHHNVLQPEPLRRPPIPRTTVGGDDWLATTIAEAAFEKSQHVDRFSIRRNVDADNFAILWVYGHKNVDPAVLCPNFRLVNDEAAPALPLDDDFLHFCSNLLEPVPNRCTCHLKLEVLDQAPRLSVAWTVHVQVASENFCLEWLSVSQKNLFGCFSKHIGEEGGQEFPEFRLHGSNLLCNCSPPPLVSYSSTMSLGTKTKAYLNSIT